jgi:ketosteroid isomerase-like protein
MSEQENLKLVQQFYAAFKTGKINGVLSTLADHVGWSVPGPKDIGAKATSKSPRRSQNLLRCRTQNSLKFKASLPRTDKVVAFGHYRWRIKSTRLSYESDFSHAFTISRGKVSRFQEYVDTQAWAAAYRTTQSLSAAK